MAKPTLFFLHALGMSGREWRHVVPTLQAEYDCVALDLPGFGEHASMGHAPLDALVDWTASTVAKTAPAGWAVVGHSMGGKVASLLASRALKGEAGLAGCLGVVLVAASPPAPEPMDEARRQEMIGWFADGAPSREHADVFVDANTARRLDAQERDMAAGDVQRSSPAAWIGWLESDSRADRAEAVGTLPFPALIVAGAEDGDLGEAAQRRLNVPHYPRSTFATIDGAAHLIPLEQPAALVACMRPHLHAMTSRMLPEAFARLLDSSRVTVAERARLVARHHGPLPKDVWSDEERATLMALVTQVLGTDVDAEDIARRLEVAVDAGAGDGWRFADLPPDRDTWPRALRTLERGAGGFTALSTTAQAEHLRHLHAGEFGDGSAAAGDDALDAGQMRHWFEDARADMVRTWSSLPATWARIGYDGFAVGGDPERLDGYVETGADRIEPWQRPGGTDE